MTITKHAALLLMTLVGVTGLLNAQTSTTVKAQVPFAFVANGKTMPAGDCTIAVVVNGQTRLSISSETGSGYQLPASKLERELQARNARWQVFTLLASAE